MRAYGRARRADIALWTRAVDGLNRALLAHFAPLDFTRGTGLSAAVGSPAAAPGDAGGDRAQASVAIVLM